MSKDFEKFISFCINEDIRKCFLSQSMPFIEFNRGEFYFYTKSVFRLLVIYGQIWLVEEFDRSLHSIDSKLKRGFYALIFMLSEELGARETSGLNKAEEALLYRFLRAIRRYANKIANEIQLKVPDDIFDINDLLSRNEIRIAEDIRLNSSGNVHDIERIEKTDLINNSLCIVGENELLKRFLIFITLSSAARNTEGYGFFLENGVELSGDFFLSLMRFGWHWVTTEYHKSLELLDTDIKNEFLDILFLMTEGGRGQGYVSDLEIADENDVFGTSGLQFVLRDYAVLFLKALI